MLQIPAVLLMIRIARTAPPDILVPTPAPGRKLYARAEVRQALSAMQHGKCCYCEKQIDIDGIFPEEGSPFASSNVEKHVEHFRPKGKNEYRRLMNCWSNLFLACNTCNVNKGQKFELDQNGNPLCIDPSDPHINPECHLQLKEMDLKFGPDSEDGKIVPRHNSAMGEWTIANIRLNEGTCRKTRWNKIFEIVRGHCELPGGITYPRTRYRAVERPR